jgi:predicted transport protein
VDSPATAMDDISRAEIASTIANHLENQYIGFILPVERDSFADVLVQETNSKVNLIVAFNTIDKDTKILKELASDYNVNTDEFKDGVVSTNNENFFWNFKTKIKGKN